MKRFGQIMFCFLPPLLAFGIQQLISIPAVGIALLKAVMDNTTLNGATYSFINNMMSSTFLELVNVCYGLTALAVFAFWFSKKFRNTERQSFTRSFHPWIIIGIVLCVIGLQYLSNYIVSFTAMIHEEWLDYYISLIEMAGLDDSVSLIMSAYSVLVAPICEELIFRGVTMQYAKKAMPFWIANLFQALLFGIYHMNVIQGVYAFVIGIVLGYICEKGGSIYLSILFHILFNLWGVFAPEWFMYGSDTLLFFFLWLFVGAVLLTGGILLYNRGVKIRNNKVNNFCQPTDM